MKLVFLFGKEIWKIWNIRQFRRTMTSHIIICLVFSFILHLSAASCSLPRLDFLQFFADFIFVFQRDNWVVSPHSGVPTHSITAIKPSGEGITLLFCSPEFYFIPPVWPRRLPAWWCFFICERIILLQLSREKCDCLLSSRHRQVGGDQTNLSEETNFY